MAHKTDHDRQSIDAMKLKLKHASTSTTTSDDDDVKIVTNCSLIAIGICDIAGAGCRALKALCSAEDSKCVRREFELEFVTSSDLRAAESDVDDDDDVDDVDDVGDEFDDDFTSLERAVFVSETAFEAVGSTTTKTNSNNGDSNAASLIQFIDTASGDANLSCIVINAVVSEQDEAAVCAAVVSFIRELTVAREGDVDRSYGEKEIVLCAAMKLDAAVARSSSVFSFGKDSSVQERNNKCGFGMLDEKNTRVRDGLLKGIISACRVAFSRFPVSGVIVSGFAVPRLGRSEEELESGETAVKLEEALGRKFKHIGVCATGKAREFVANRLWWKSSAEAPAKHMMSMFT